MTNNYFRCGKEAFFFNDREMRSVSYAFRLALDHQIESASGPNSRPRIVVYRRPEQRGAWDDLVRVVGEPNLREVQEPAN